MRFSTTIAAAAMAGSSSALTMDVPASTAMAFGLAAPPAAAEPTGVLQKRKGPDYSCITSISSKLTPETISNHELGSALTSIIRSQGGLTDPRDVDMCTVTLASSLSAEFSSWLGEAKGKYESTLSYLKGLHTKCDVDTFDLSIVPLCTKTSITAVYTGTAISDATTTSLDNPAPPTTTVIHVGSAPGFKSALGSVVAVAAAAGAVLLL